MPRFVILEHDHPVPHLDIMIERDGKLHTWRGPIELQSGAPFSAEALGDHRLDYLDYEGPVSGGRGSVVRRDAGAFEWVIDAPDRVIVALAGRRYRGRLELQRAAANWRGLWICD